MIMNRLNIRSCWVIVSAAALLTLVFVPLSPAAARNVTVVAGTIAPCPDCSVPEDSMPRKMKFAVRTIGVIYVWDLNWSSWGSAATRGHGKARVETNGYEYGRVRISLSRIRRHAPDGCGNTGTGRVYTRAILRTRGFRHNKTAIVNLPRSGCETR